MLHCRLLNAQRFAIARCQAHPTQLHPNTCAATQQRFLQSFEHLPLDQLASLLRIYPDLRSDPRRLECPVHQHCRLRTRLRLVRAILVSTFLLAVALSFEVRPVVLLIGVLLCVCPQQLHRVRHLHLLQHPQLLQRFIRIRHPIRRSLRV